MGILRIIFNLRICKNKQQQRGISRNMIKQRLLFLEGHQRFEIIARVDLASLPLCEVAFECQERPRW
jgi:hypothetical protein